MIIVNICKQCCSQAYSTTNLREKRDFMEKNNSNENHRLFLCLNQMLSALCLSYHPNTKAVLFASLLSDWATTTGKLLVLKMENSIKNLSQEHRDVLPNGDSNKVLQPFDFSPGALPTDEPCGRHSLLIEREPDQKKRNKVTGPSVER